MIRSNQRNNSVQQVKNITKCSNVCLTHRFAPYSTFPCWSTPNLRHSSTTNHYSLCTTWAVKLPSDRFLLIATAWSAGMFQCSWHTECESVGSFPPLEKCLLTFGLKFSVVASSLHLELYLRKRASQKKNEKRWKGVPKSKRPISTYCCPSGVCFRGKKTKSRRIIKNLKNLEKI